MNATRSEVRKALAGADYPASREELIALAEQHDASDEVIEDLEGLAEEEYASAAEVMAELGEEEDDEE
jgi:predicted Zn-ribbon and HTH transcriptional regulator